MGLDTTHDCWHGPYSSFNEWREWLADRAKLPPLRSMQGFGGDRSWADYEHDPICLLINHSDRDGRIEAKDCATIASRLRELVKDWAVIPSAEWAVDAAHRFADGLERAAAAGEDVEFH